MINFYRDKILQGMKVFGDLSVEMMASFKNSAQKIESEMMPAIIPEILGFKQYNSDELLDIFDYTNRKEILFKDLSQGEGYYTLCKLKQDNRFELWTANNHFRERIYTNIIFNNTEYQKVKVVSQHEYPFMFYNGSYKLGFGNKQFAYADALNFKCFNEMILPQYLNTSLSIFSKKIKLISKKKKAIISPDKTIKFNDKLSYKPKCIVKGKIIKLETIKNPINTNKIISLYVDTDTAVFIVLTKAEFVNNTFNVGDYIKVNGWLNCRVKCPNES